MVLNIHSTSISAHQKRSVLIELVPAERPTNIPHTIVECRATFPQLPPNTPSQPIVYRWLAVF
jgi:hypothetical protein